jgi:hypothetical protein
MNPTLPPIDLVDFAEANWQAAAGPPIGGATAEAWRTGRDWLASRVLGQQKGRTAPRAPVVVRAHLAGFGAATTGDLGFDGLALKTGTPVPLAPGAGVSVRLLVWGRSIYVLGTVVWIRGEEMGIRFVAMHPDDGRAIEATVCGQLLQHWA